MLLELLLLELLLLERHLLLVLLLLAFQRLERYQELLAQLLYLLLAFPQLGYHLLANIIRAILHLQLKPMVSIYPCRQHLHCPRVLGL